MSYSRDARQPSRSLKLMLIEDDPVFRLGLVVCLEPFADLSIVVEADSAVRALQLLEALPNAMDTIVNQPIASQPNANQSTVNQLDTDEIADGIEGRSLDLIILNLDLGQTSSQGGGLALCQQLRTQYPQLPLLLLGSTLELTRLAAAFQSGAGGYCLKGTGVMELVAAIRQVVSGQPYWTEGIQAIAQPLNASQLTRRSTANATPLRLSPNETTLPDQRWLSIWRRKLRLSGVQQIERAIVKLETQLQTDRAIIDQLILAGQRRELYTARWLVNRLLSASSEAEAPERRRTLNVDTQTTPSLAAEATSEPASKERSAALTETIAGSIQSPQAALFQTTLTKLQGNLQNLTATTLEIDILKDAKKRELLQLVLRKLQELLAALRSQLSPEQLEKKRSVILQDLWQATVTDFFGKYYTLQIETQSIEVVTVLLQDLAIVEAEILDKIPLFPEFLSHLLFQTPLTVEDATYAAGAVEAMAQMELLLQNVIFQVANAVMQPLLNRFGNVTVIKQAFYDKRLLSSREIERFRNDLSWKYRTDRVFAESVAIFESQYYLLTLTEMGISKTTIYAPRNDELRELSGLPFLVTLVLEARDAIAPRVRAAVSLVGRGFVYVLTEVIGRGIGLIGRGIIKGVGNALQETKPKRNRERWR